MLIKDKNNLQDEILNILMEIKFSLFEKVIINKLAP
jgi:hypothetical protein